MSEKEQQNAPENCSCCTCGYTWVKGQYGGHSCADQLLARVAELEAERDRSKRSAQANWNEFAEGLKQPSAGVDERSAFDLAYQCAVDNGWESTKELARYIWDQARAQLAAPERAPMDMLKLRETALRASPWAEHADRTGAFVKGAMWHAQLAAPAGVPDGWREFIEDCATTAGGMVNGNRLSHRAAELLAAAPSPAPVYRCHKCMQETQPPAPYEVSVKCTCGAWTAATAAAALGKPASDVVPVPRELLQGLIQAEDDTDKEGSASFTIDAYNRLDKAWKELRALLNGGRS